jgi:D-glycerate 3-kinase
MPLSAYTLQQLSKLALSEPASVAYQQLLLSLALQLTILPKPAVIGITGAQGTGKSTLAALLVTELKYRGIRGASVSLDDYYLSKAKRAVLAEQVHPLLAQRGVPGTHDIHKALADAQQVMAGQPVALPVFDKAQDDRRPDRPAATLDLLLVEGWCLGLQAQSAAELVLPVNTLEAEEDPQAHWRKYVNQQLAGAYHDYFCLLKPLIWLKAPDWPSVCRWRERQEQQLWQQRGAGMSAAQLQRFMLFFQRLTALSYQQLPARANYTVVLNALQQPYLSS